MKHRANTMLDDTMLQIEALCFAYPECAVLSQWSAALPAGVLLLRGDESSGKTTLLRLIAGELVAQSGRMSFGGGTLGGGPSPDGVFWADPRSVAADERTARAWLDGLPARYPQWDSAALGAHIDGFSLSEHLHKPFYALSTGSKRKVLMAGALASGAGLTLIDEPVAGLDKPSIAYLAHALTQTATRARQEGRVVLVAHYETLPGVAWSRVIEIANPAHSPDNRAMPS